jgi:heptosyltransferase-1
MGDVLHAIPAVSSLRKTFPNARIGWVIEERWAELICSPGTPRSGPRLAQRPLVDRVHVVDTRGWRKALLSRTTRWAVTTIVQEMRSEKYDVVIDFQGAVRSALLGRSSGAPVVYGFAQPRENAASMFYTRQVLSAATHVVDQNIFLARAVARRDLTMGTPELPRDPSAESSVANRLKLLNVSSFAILNPGAGWGAKQWPAERYGQVAKLLAEKTGISSLVNYGPGEEKLASQVGHASCGFAQAITASISELIALTRRASLFIGGDTGPLHLAALLDIPVVAIFGPTNPARNGPYGTRSVVLRNQESVTSHARTPLPEPAMLEIGVDHVLQAALRVLGDTGG